MRPWIILAAVVCASASAFGQQYYTKISSTPSDVVSVPAGQVVEIVSYRKENTTFLNFVVGGISRSFSDNVEGLTLAGPALVQAGGNGTYLLTYKLSPNPSTSGNSSVKVTLDPAPLQAPLGDIATAIKKIKKVK